MTKSLNAVLTLGITFGWACPTKKSRHEQDQAVMHGASHFQQYKHCASKLMTMNPFLINPSRFHFPVCGSQWMAHSSCEQETAVLNALASIMIAKRALPSTAASHVMFCSELNSHYCPSIENCKALCGSCCMDTYRVGCGWATCYVDSVSHARSGRRFFNSSVAVGEWMRRPVWLQLSWPTTLLRCCWLLS
jgi:hypothetical protein